MSASSSRPPTEVVTERICDFLEICCHSILYVKKVYPAEVFERRRRCGHVVWWCKSTLVSDYTKQVFASLRDVIRRRLLSSLYVVITTPGFPVETYSFNFDPAWRSLQPSPAAIPALLLSINEACARILTEIQTKVSTTDDLSDANDMSPPSPTWELKLETVDPVDVSLSMKPDKKWGWELAKDDKAAYHRLQCNWVSTMAVQHASGQSPMVMAIDSQNSARAEDELPLGSLKYDDGSSCPGTLLEVTLNRREI